MIERPRSTGRWTRVLKTSSLAAVVCLAGCAAGPNAGGDSRTPYKGNAVWNIARCVDTAPTDGGGISPG